MSTTTITEIQKSLSETTREAAERAVEEGGEVKGLIDGVTVVTRYENTVGRGTIVTYSSVHMDGFHFGTEVDRVPWSIFDDPTTTYRCLGLLQRQEAQALVREAGLAKGKSSLVEEPYQDENGPVLYEIWVSVLEDAVALYKAYRAKHPDRVAEELAVKEETEKH